VYRGFSASVRSMVRDRSADRLHRLNADVVTDELLELAQTGQVQELGELWTFLEERLGLVERHITSGATTLPPDLIEATQAHKSSLFKLLLVRAIQGGRSNDVKTIFEQQTLQANGLEGAEWRPWFALPYCTDPQTDIYFGPYFQHEWYELFAVSLNNFVAQVFKQQPAPKLLAFPLARRAENALKAKLRAKEFECAQQNEEIEQLRLMILNRQVASESICATSSRGSEDLMQRERVQAPLAPEDSDLKPHTPPGLAVGMHHAKVNMARFAPGNKVAATASNDCTVKLWDVPESESGRTRIAAESGKGALQQEQMIFCPSAALSLEWHAESPNLLAIGTGSSLVKIWDTHSGSEKGEISTVGLVQAPFVVDMNICPRKQLLSTISVGQANQVHEDHSGPSLVGGDNFDLSYGSEVLSVSLLNLWSISTLQLVSSLELNSLEMICSTFNHNGSLLVGGAADGVIRVYDVQKGAPIMEWKAHPGGEAICKVALTSDETAVATLARDGSIAIWSLHRTGETLCKYAGPSKPFAKPDIAPNDYLRHGDLVLDTESPGFLLAASPVFGSEVRQFGVHKMSTKRIQTGHQGYLTSLDVTSMGILATASVDKTIQTRKLT